MNLRRAGAGCAGSWGALDAAQGRRQLQWAGAESGERQIGKGKKKKKKKIECNVLTTVLGVLLIFPENK